MKLKTIALLLATAITAAQAADPVANAGPDVTIADFDGNASVTIVLDASASADADGNITSYAWTWPGGSASGIAPEVVFPATNSPVTITLTVTDATGGSSVDSLTVAAFTKQAGLFTDFKKPAYSGTDSSNSIYGTRVVGTLRGNTLVIDPKGSGVPEIYQFNAGNWTPSTFTASVSDIRAIDGNTLLSGNIASGNAFTAHRLVAGNWIATPQSVSATPPGRRIQDNAYETGAVASCDSFDDTYFNNAGRAFVYDGTGDTWTHTELLPPEGFTAGKRWGEGIDTDGTTTAVTDGSGSSVVPNLKIFKKTGSWTHQVSLAPPVEPGGFPQSYFSGIVAVGNGVVVVQREFPHALFVIEFDGASWVQTKLPISPLIPSGGYFGLEMDDDGQSFVAHDQAGRFILYQKDTLASSWATATVTQRQLPITGMFAGNQLLCTEFSGGKIVLSDAVNGVVRVFDKNAPFDTINAEPVANAGADISTTSFDGNPVRVFLNGGLSYDASANETLTAVWSWNGGGATGLQTFAMVPVDVATITLTLTDSKGAISRDSLVTNIKRPPVIHPGNNLVAADSDADGLIHLRVNPTVVSQSNPIVSWNWRWPGGTFSGRSGVITLGPDADGKPITLEVIDSAGLSSTTSFTFDLLDPDPVPDLIEPVDGVSLDRYGWAVGIREGVALTGAPFKTGNGTYFAENLNGEWQQYSFASSDRRGQAVLIDGEFAFVGAQFQGTGAVIVYKNQAGSWVASQTLVPGDPEGAGFGNAIARDGDTLIIGAPRTGAYGALTGAVYVFELSAGTWSQAHKIVTPDPPTFFGDEFGAKVAISGDFLAVAQPGFATTSSVFVYEKGASSWSLIHEFEADIPRVPQNRGPNNDGDFFGVGLAMDGSELLVGSPQDDQVFRYTRSASVWTRNGQIAPGNYRFGKSLALKDAVLVVGAYLDDSGRSFLNVDYTPGSVVVFSRNGGTWLQVGHVWPDKTQDHSLIETPEYGYSVAHDGKDLIVGLPWARNSSGVQSGKTYIYRNYAALNPDANYEPRANAGTDISVNDTVVRGPAPDYLITEPSGSELVTLDASASSDQENAIVSYAWSWPGGSASGVTADVRFPVGTTVVSLTVTDDKGIVNSDTLNVTVALAQTPPGALPGSTNTLSVNLPVPGAKWRLSSEFLWHGSGESADDVVLGETYQLEILGYPGSAETVTTFVTINSANSISDLTLILPLPPVETGTVSFPETAQGFAWRLRGESVWRNVVDDGDAFDELIEATLATGELVIDYKPVSGYATPASQLVTILPGETLALNWNDYQRIDNFDPAKTFAAAVSPNLGGDPYQYVGLIRTPLGRGTGTVVAERVVLTAAHLFFDSTGLQWADTQWFPRQQQGEHQAPPVAPRGILYQTAYAQIVAPDSVQNPVATVPADKKEADFAVLYFSGAGDWEGGSANYLQSTAERNWLTGTENKQAVGYAQRSQPYEQRGKLFGKTFTAPLSPLDSHPLPKLYETGELFGDGGASGSALFVQPAGVAGYYPAAILLAGQDRAVYRVIDQDVGRMIQDAQDAASGNDEVLDSNFSLVTYGAGGLRALAVSIATPAVLTTARWSVRPNVGTAYSNLAPTQRVGFSSSWSSVTVSFSAVSGYQTPPPLTLSNSQVPPGGITTIGNVVYEPLSGFDLWKQSQGIANTVDDRDHDGRNALVEYAINGNPDSGSDPVPIRMAANPLQAVNAEFEVFVSATADGIRYEVKASDTLPPTNVATLATFTKADGTNGYKRVVDVQPKSASPTRFAWLEITHDRSLSTGP
jgi:hypothetical protein